METIKFSVLIPVYNGEDYLDECVHSVLRQEYDNFEIIIADDGSDDKTAEICDGYKDERIKVYHNENRGPLMTRVFAISKASGDYCLFVDCDDYVDSGYLKRLNDIINKEKCDMVVCSFRSVDKCKISEAAKPWNEQKTFAGETLKEFWKEFLFCTYLNSICTKIVRTSLLKSDTTDFKVFAQFRNGEDLILSLYPVFNAEKIVYIPECWYNYRTNISSITHTISLDRYKSVFAARKQAYKYLKGSGLFDDNIRRQYFGFVIKLVVDCIKKISLSKVDKKEKIKAFDGISNDEFYHMVSSDYDSARLNIKEKIVYGLFRHKLYGAILMIINS